MEEFIDDHSMDFSYSFLKGINPNSLPSTITIPDVDLSQMGNMERQYWEIKSNYFNVLIFFKKGKFYELYDYDAVIGKKEFGLKMVFDTTNRGKMRLAGVPEQSYSEWARLFVFRGYKVGRVEQMKEDTNGGLKRKVVPRELVEIITPGTVTDSLMISDYKELYVLSVVPLPDGNIDAFAVDLSRRVSMHCACYPSGKEDCANLNFLESCNALYNLLQLLRPREIIIPTMVFGYEQEKWKEKVDFLLQLIKCEGYNCEFVNVEVTEREYCSAAMTVIRKYFCYLKIGANALFVAPLEYCSHLDTSSKHGVQSATPALSLERKNDCGMFIDAQSSGNLELICNLRDRCEKDSLFEFVNHCSTNGGKRLLSSWILRPSCCSKVIAARQESIRFLSSVLRTPQMQKQKRCRRNDGVVCDFHSRFSNMSFDLERQLSRLAEMKNENSNISYVDPQVQLNKNLRLIFSFVDSLTETVSWGIDFKEIYCHSESTPSLLQEIVTALCKCKSTVCEIGNLFDREASERNGALVPGKGSNMEFDASNDLLVEVKQELEKFRQKVQAEVFHTNIQYCDLGKDLFLVEVPLTHSPKMTPPRFVERARSSRSVKYVALDVEPLIEKFRTASREVAEATGSNLRVVATKICDHSVMLNEAFSAISYFDCLLSFARLHVSHSEHTTFPRIVVSDASGVGITQGFINATSLTHPLLSSSAIPSSLSLNSASGRILLLTGPNMAGKSTLMRSVATNLVLAQLGGAVFAENFDFSPFSRIFTRIGARDATHRGHSTLFVELSETANILHHADARSLCLVDELGRGTSTHDGLAIASATLSALENMCGGSPITIFSTHYHTLALEKQKYLRTGPPANVQLGFMNYHIQTSTEVSLEINKTVTPITFLYTLTPGICERSFGIEVAKMAALPTRVLDLAREEATKMLHQSTIRNDLHTIITLKDGLTNN